MSRYLVEELDAVRSWPGSEAAPENSTRKALRDKVNYGVRGLMETGATLPHLTADVAGCYHAVDSEVEEDVEATEQLVDSKVINWCRTARPLRPLAVHGGGSCVEVACSILLWGVSDLAALLQRLVYVSLFEFGVPKFQQRWKRQLDIGTEAWGHTRFQESEGNWEQLIRSVQQQRNARSNDPFGVENAWKETGVPLSDNIRIFVLANVLRRAIIVVGAVPQRTGNTVFERDCDAERYDLKGDSIAGIYLPLLWKPEDCVRYPVILAVVEGRFVPLTGQQRTHGGATNDLEMALDVVPVVTSRLEPLHVWFLLEAEEAEAYTLLQRYMKMTEVNLTRSHSIDMVLTARIRFQALDLSTSGSSLVAPTPVRSTAAVENSSTSGIAEICLVENQLPSDEQQSILGGLVSMDRRQLPACGNTRHTGLAPAATADLSIVNEHCHAVGCANHASWFIYPYCYEHIDRRIVESTVARRQQTPALSPPDSSMLMVRCEQPGCRNMSSRFVYPYCYEHIDARINSGQQHQHATLRAQQDEYLVSISPDRCVHPSCVNQASIYTYPVCYEHLDFLATSTAAAEGRMDPSHAGVTQLPTAAAVSSLGDVPNYNKAMSEVESRTRSAIKCRVDGCNNYGNSRCHGMCHNCYQQQLQPQNMNFPLQ